MTDEKTMTPREPRKPRKINTLGKPSETINFRRSHSLPVNKPINSFHGNPGPIPASIQNVNAPPVLAIRHVLQWTLSTSSTDLPARLDMIAQSILIKMAKNPGEWLDLNSTIIKSDLFPDIISRVTTGSSLKNFSDHNLSLEKDGNKIRFTKNTQ